MIVNKFKILVFFLISILNSLSADPIRYIDEVFENVTITEDVVYGNAPDLPFIFLFEWNTYDVDLDMDIYEPEGDTETHRPVIIFIHAGAFFSGHNELDDVVALSISAAKRGYVGVSINYRLGLNILSSYSGERAVYRGVQDASAVVRYLKEFSNEYNIDTNNIFVWGTSAGSFIGLHLTYSEDDERPESTYGGGDDPDLGCIDCEGNYYEHNSKPKALVSCWGAIKDLDWIDPENDVPTILFHGTDDLIVPYNSGFPFSLNILLPIVHGSNLIQGRLNELGIDHEFHGEEGQPHEYWGTINGNWLNGPNEYFEQIKSDAFLFLYDQIFNEEISIDYQADWNLVGMALEVEDSLSNILFPESIDGTLYSFDGGYNLETNLSQGEGYWLRFNEAGSTTFSGTPFNEISVQLNEGWNLISGLSESISIYSILDPDSIIVSGTFYGFNAAGYIETVILEPGKGYWIRTSGSGSITFISD